ncbi:LysR family transcriptional regulator [Acuticoccus sp. M5D2P5]|uniref:LysR family transcriptional regulator n=1 Tax=Acuticoccus kalidii TaxID=2910977 RepID=UPI001F3380E7|nr:LysR family transcriptional regulator [Acuticoccus kalidii]MCF3934924.1 LysR family transcriptional regulator [Acuticoccus kalidii]
MDRLRGMEVFVAVADAGSLAEAARLIGMSAPAVTRAINALETRLGVRLFTRTTRSLRLTDAGALYLARCRDLLTAIAAAEEEAVGRHGQPSGRLRITSPTRFGQLHVVPVLTRFLDAYPQVSIEAIFVDRVTNLVEEGFDVAVRIGPLPDSRLVATRVGTVRRVVCAAPDYLSRYGRPETLADLAGHRLIAATPMNAADEWSFGEAGSVAFTPRLRVSTIDAAIAAARHGWGLARVISYQVVDDFASGTLVSVLDEVDPAELPVHLLRAEGRVASAKVRAFVDHAKEALGRVLAFEAPSS